MAQIFKLEDGTFINLSVFTKIKPPKEGKDAILFFDDANRVYLTGNDYNSLSNQEGLFKLSDGTIINLSNFSKLKAPANGKDATIFFDDANRVYLAEEDYSAILTKLS